MRDKLIIILIAVSLLLIAGCKNCLPYNCRNVKCPGAYCDNGQCKCPIMGDEKECTTDADCITGGCSGTICQSKNTEPAITTCEFLPEYACYKQIRCGCVDGKCQWDKTKEFERCVNEAREAGGDVIV